MLKRSVVSPLGGMLVLLVALTLGVGLVQQRNLVGSKAAPPAGFVCTTAIYNDDFSSPTISSNWYTSSNCTIGSGCIARIANQQLNLKAVKSIFTPSLERAQLMLFPVSDYDIEVDVPILSIGSLASGSTTGNSNAGLHYFSFAHGVPYKFSLDRQKTNTSGVISESVNVTVDLTNTSISLPLPRNTGLVNLRVTRQGSNVYFDYLNPAVSSSYTRVYTYTSSSYAWTTGGAISLQTALTSVIGASGTFDNFNSCNIVSS